ncbi:MAG TPA: hypothetical protein DHV39_04205 [Verrucomicrobiales bacterium]|nr:hypothetical protein [Verrucomicrobiales bacterium]
MSCHPRKERASTQLTPDKNIPSFLISIKDNEPLQLSGLEEEEWLTFYNLSFIDHIDRKYSLSGNLS